MGGRYLRLLAVFVGATLSAQLEYRANFLGAVLAAVGEVAVALLGLAVLFGQPEVNTVGGWSFREALLVVGFFTLTQGVIATFIQPNLSRIAEAVRTGQMDFVLLKPLDAQFYVSSRQADLLRLPEVFIGLGLIVYAAWGLGVTASGVLAAAGLYACALGMVYAIWMLLSTTAFWFVKTQNASELFQGVFGAGRFPVSAFPARVGLLLTFVVPIAFITTVPAQALTGGLGAGTLLAAPALAGALLLLSRLFWRKAVGSYTSASS